MKAHRFKSKLTSQQEVSDEFYNLVGSRINDMVTRNMKQQEVHGVIAEMQFRNSEYYRKRVAEIKLETIKMWETKGRNMAFLKPEDTFMNLLNLKHFGTELPNYGYGKKANQ